MGFFNTKGEKSHNIYYVTQDKDNTSKSVNHYPMLYTVKQNKYIFTKSGIAGSDETRKLQQIAVWTSNNSFKYNIENNLIENCGIADNDDNRAELIHSHPIPLLQGKMVIHKQPIHGKIQNLLCL